MRATQSPGRSVKQSGASKTEAQESMAGRESEIDSDGDQYKQRTMSKMVVADSHKERESRSKE